jgi:histidinol-phosphate aminotransferase
LPVSEPARSPVPGIVAAIAAASLDAHRYPDPGCAGLTRALARRHGVAEDRILVGAGSLALLQALFQVAGETGAEVMYAWRSCELYPVLADLAGVRSVRVALSQDVHDLGAMANRITAATRLVVICNPNNPTGTVVGRDELHAFLGRVPPTCLVAIDEAYAEYVCEPTATSGLELRGAHPNLVVLRTFSKAYELASLRVGYLVGPAGIVTQLRKACLPYAVGGVAQQAALAALGCEDEVLRRVAATIAERVRVRDALLAGGWDVPDGQGSFLWLGLGADAAMFGRLCADAGVAARTFDGEGVRVPIGSARDSNAFLAVADGWQRRMTPVPVSTGGSAGPRGDSGDIGSAQAAAGSARLTSGSAVSRQVVVSPGMCSGGSLVFGRIGDWTWEAVAAACRINVHAARTAEGHPAYLSFYYYRVRGGNAVHPHGLTFGDELQVSSRVFQFGSQSVLTLHRLAPAGLGLAGTVLDPVEVYELPHPDCMYAENLNRWISRSRPGSNRGLTEVAPPGFAYAGLPRLPNQYSPRTLAGRARKAGSFCVPPPRGFTVAGHERVFEYELDAARDVNGAGLLYFASYFSIFDTALLRLWRALGRSDEQFLQRRVIDQKLAYFGNADPGTVFSTTVRRWCSAAQPEIEIADMALRDSAAGRLLAVMAVEITSGAYPN